jgi:hypothetical protein
MDITVLVEEISRGSAQGGNRTFAPGLYGGDHEPIALSEHTGPNAAKRAKAIAYGSRFGESTRDRKNGQTTVQA